MNYSLGRRYCLGQHTSSPGPGAELFQPEPGGGGGAWEAIAWVHCLVGSGKFSAIAKLAGLERSLETKVSMALQNIPTDAELNQPTDSQH